MRLGRSLLACCATAVLGAAGRGQAPPPVAPSEEGAVTWRIDDLSSIGGQAVTVVGSPRVVDTPAGRAVAFDGKGDGLFLDVNPLAGLARFTIEAFIQPTADGPAEQRFLHFSETASDDRAMLETRVLPGGLWCLDTYLRRAPASLTLLDRSRTHPTGSWHTVALVYDGGTLRHFVDGRPDGEGRVAFAPLGAGRTSIGVRQNKVSWFKGAIALVRITPRALPAERLLEVPARGFEGLRPAVYAAGRGDVRLRRFKYRALH